MPIHDWTKVEPTIFHDFHQAWSMEIRNALNRGLLPPGYSALVEQHVTGLVPDVLTLQGRTKRSAGPVGGALLAEPPATTFSYESSSQRLASRGNRIAIHHTLGNVVCIIEIVSPGNKSSQSALRSFVEKTVGFLKKGIHVLVVDLFPPSKRDPEGVHGAIWSELEDENFVLPRDKPLTLAAYVAGDPTSDWVTRAFVEPVAVGQSLPSMPAYLDHSYYVPIPLETTYWSAWQSCPEDMRVLVETGELPEELDEA